MAESSLEVTPGTGTKLHTNTRSIGGNTVHDEVVLAGEPYLATYVVPFVALSVATVGTHVVAIQAGATLPVYIRRIWIETHNPAAWAGSGNIVVQLTRLTTAGTGGTAVTPVPLDSTDAASGATARLRPTSPGTEGAVLHPLNVANSKIASDTAPPAAELRFDIGRSKGLRIAAGTANGITLKLLNADATGTINGFIELSEATF